MSAEPASASAALRAGGALIVLDVLSVRLGRDARRWVESMNGLIHPLTRGRAAFLDLFADTAAQLGDAAVSIKVHEREALATAGIEWRSERATALDELGRIALLLVGAAYLVPDEFGTLVRDAYRHSDTRARVAVLRGLPLLPRAERFTPIAADACRSTERTLFEAVACDNPFAARAFPDAEFHPMVVRALELGLPLDRIVGLEARRSTALCELVRAHWSLLASVGQPLLPDADLLLE
jgi:hypothetical protein